MSYIGHRDRGRLKARAVRQFLHGMTHEQIAAAAAHYCEAAWPRLMRPDAMSTWREWKAKGACMTIVTASPDVVVHPFARRLEADVLLGTRLSFDGNGRVDGAFEGENCRAMEKVLRLRTHFGPQVRLAAAYGDTSGDTEMLEIAEVKGFRAFTGRPDR